MQNRFYRPEIDGLRAVAVLSVVLFHGNISGFSGGFVGVDVFFVVSGFLITQILMRHITEKDFSIALFYERRLRRITPALVMVLLVSSLLAELLLLPEDLAKFAKSLVATVFFSSNFYFWSDTGYFAAPAEFKPLLHTWSLAVEEQFYIVYPLMLAAVLRFCPERLTIFVWLGLLASFVLSVWATLHTPGAAFYLPVTRAWELLLGALLALNAVPAVSGRLARETTATTGLGLIMWAVFAFTAQTPFPGLAALAPCLGAAMFIHANTRGSTLAGRMLSFRLLVGIGLISYSLYLWHWPLFVFTKYFLVRHLYPMEVAGVIAATAVLSVLSWRWVEQPFRQVSGIFPQRLLFVTASGCAGLLILVALGLISNDGQRGRFNEQELQLLVEAQQRPQDRLNCLDPTAEQVLEGGLCMIGEKTNSPPAFVLWGDSHAEAIRAALELKSLEAGVWGYFAFYVSCPPLLGVENRWMPTTHACAQFNQAMAVKVQQLEVRDVVLVGMWAAYPTGRIQLAGSVGSTVERSEAAFIQGLGNTLGFLRENGVRVWIVAQVPTAEVDVAKAVALRRRYSIAMADIEPSAADHKRRQAFVAAAFESATHQPEVYVLDPALKLCGVARCRVLAGEHSLYWDDDHLSEYGARWIVEIFSPMFDHI